MRTEPSNEPHMMLTVVLVDQRDRDRQALQFALELRGYAVSVAHDAGSALAAVQRQAPDLIIVGWLPGGADAAAQLCAALRATPNGRLATILVSANPEQPAEIVAALDAGASGYLRAPLDAAQLRERLTRAEQQAAGWRAADADLAAVRDSEARFRALVEHALDVIAILSVDGTILYASPALERMLGHASAGLIGSNSFALVHTDDAGDVLGLLTAALNTPGLTEPIEAHLLRRDGGWTIAELRATNLQHIPAVGGIVVYARDITTRKQFEEQLERRALYDPLTTLPNRTLFMDYLEHALARADRRLESIVVLFTDLDNFKMINDSFGHAFGDQLLVRVAERLRACLRSSDTAARLGGDEFTVLLEEISASRDAVIVAERIIRELSAPYFLDGHEVFVTISVGIAPSTPGESRPGDLLRDADVALYRAKAEGKSRWAMFSPELLPRAEHAERAEHGVYATTQANAAPAAPPAAEPESAAPDADNDSDSQTTETLQLLLARIAELEREAGRLEARVRQAHIEGTGPGREQGTGNREQ
jgi:diguanylate cyclase (GGDEF)-like protein/PAS domain S-box-containing protein